MAKPRIKIDQYNFEARFETAAAPKIVAVFRKLLPT